MRSGWIANGVVMAGCFLVGCGCHSFLSTRGDLRIATDITESGDICLQWEQKATWPSNLLATSEQTNIHCYLNVVNLRSESIFVYDDLDVVWYTARQIDQPKDFDEIYSTGHYWRFPDGRHVGVRSRPIIFGGPGFSRWIGLVPQYTPWTRSQSKYKEFEGWYAYPNYLMPHDFDIPATTNRTSHWVLLITCDMSVFARGKVRHGVVYKKILVTKSPEPLVMPNSSGEETPQDRTPSETNRTGNASLHSIPSNNSPHGGTTLPPE